MVKKSGVEAWDEEVDVIIAGAGGAGLEAAVEAAGAGAETIVFEKMDRLWESSTAISVGMISFAGTDIQKKLGIKDSGELFFKDIMEVGKQQNDPEVVRAYVDNQMDTYKQLTKLGAKWSEVVAGAAGMSVPRGHLTDPIDLVRNLRRAAEARGATVAFQAKVADLITDSNKRVIGAKVNDRNGPVNIKARKGVILATGGFARDPKRMSSINPKFANVLATTGKGHTGDGLVMAEKLGAYFKDMAHVKPSFELYVHGSLAEDIVLLYLLGGIIVNKKGLRYLDESISYKDTGMITLDQPDAIGFQIIDQKIYERALEEGRKSTVPFPLGIDASKARLLVKADTVEELAEKIGVPPKALRNTFDRYNGFVEKGKDRDFGRKTQSANMGKLVKLDTPPFYSMETVGHFLSTYAGLAVDKDMHVLTKKGIIPGLYAAGEVVVGFHGTAYHSGTAVGKALIFGRIAGRNAAAGK